MSTSKESTVLKEARCPVCGRIFVPAPYHVYKSKDAYFCRYNCYNKFLTEKESRTNKYSQTVKTKKTKRSKQ